MSNLRDLIDHLDTNLTGPHPRGNFDFHYLERGLRTGRGWPPHEVRSSSMVDAYAEGLEMAYAATYGNAASVRTHVYLWNISPWGDIEDLLSPFTTHQYDDAHPPVVCLRARLGAPTAQEELSLAMADAVHEGIHVWQLRHVPPVGEDLLRSSRRWLVEATTCVLRLTGWTPQNSHWTIRPDATRLRSLCAILLNVSAWTSSSRSGLGRT